MRKKTSSKKSLPKVSYLAKAFYFIKKIVLIRGFLPVLAVVIFCVWFKQSGHLDKIINHVNDTKSQIYSDSGIILENILLEGQKNSDKQEILDAITFASAEKIQMGMPLMDIDLEKIKQRLEEIAWVHAATVERQLPSTLSVSIAEKKPVAFWQNNGKLHLIDEYGKIIDEDDLSDFKDLIILVGNDIEYSAEEALGIISSSEDLAPMVSSAIRVGNRRWNIRLKNDVEVKLPEKKPIDAWKFLEKSNAETSLLSSNIKSVDLRVAEKMFVQ